jgi:hypothetical protein
MSGTIKMLMSHADEELRQHIERARQEAGDAVERLILAGQDGDKVEMVRAKSGRRVHVKDYGLYPKE